jgi:hypothetical protein
MSVIEGTKDRRMTNFLIMITKIVQRVNKKEERKKRKIEGIVPTLEGSK